MITNNKNGLPDIAKINVRLEFVTGIGNAVLQFWIQNTTGATITIAKYTTGKYRMSSNTPGTFRNAVSTRFLPGISDWASIPLSKTTWGDYNYHFVWISDTAIDIYCQKTSDNTYQDFTEVFDGILIPVEIDIYNLPLP